MLAHVKLCILFYYYFLKYCFSITIGVGFGMVIFCVFVIFDFIGVFVFFYFIGVFSVIWIVHEGKRALVGVIGLPLPVS